MDEVRMIKWTLVGLLLIFAMMLVCGCESVRYVTVPVETVKTTYVDRQHRDSIYITDSVYVRDKGDTVWLTRWRTTYKDRIVRDSVFLRDSIPVPYPVEVVREVEKEMNWFGKLKVWLGNAVLLCLSGMGGWWVIRRKAFKRY